MNAPATQSSFWQSRSTRTIRGVTVSFYKRRSSASYIMDFTVNYQRVQKTTGQFTIDDAMRVATAKIKELQEQKRGIAPAVAAAKRGPQRCATVQEIELAVESGDKILHESTMSVYLSGLRRLASVIDADNPRAQRLDVVLAEENLLRFYASGQGTKNVNRVDELPCNGGLNTTIRNVKSLFHPNVVKAKFAALQLPDLEPLRGMFFLKRESSRFEPWEPEVYAAMEAASLRLRDLRSDGPLVPGMLVRTVYQTRTSALRDLGDKEGIVMEVLEASAVVEWVLDGAVLRHEVPLTKLRAVQVDYAELWLVNTMLRRLGLRCVELLAARRDWVEQRPDENGHPQWVLSLRDRPDFKVRKHGAPRNLALDAELCALLLARTGHLIGPDMAPEARKILVERYHSTWLRQFIPDRAKSNHELRMWAGSIVYQRETLKQAAYFLGHKSQITTERFYATWFQTARALDGHAVGTARLAAPVANVVPMPAAA